MFEIDIHKLFSGFLGSQGATSALAKRFRVWGPQPPNLGRYDYHMAVMLQGPNFRVLGLPKPPYSCMTQIMQYPAARSLQNTMPNPQKWQQS